MNQIRRQRRCHQAVDARTAGRIPEDGDVAGIATERGDVALHPLQRGDLIKHRVIAGDVVRRFSAQFRMCEETENPDAIVERDEHDSFSRKRLAVQAAHGTVAALVAAAINPDHDGPPLIRILRSRPDIQVQAVLAHRRRFALKIFELIERTRFGENLHRYRTELIRLAYAIPRRDRPRRPPAQITDRRRGKRNPLEYTNLWICAANPAHESRIKFHRFHGGTAKTACQQQTDWRNKKLQRPRHAPEHGLHGCLRHGANTSPIARSNHWKFVMVALPMIGWAQRSGVIFCFFAENGGVIAGPVFGARKNLPRRS